MKNEVIYLHSRLENIECNMKREESRGHVAGQFVNIIEYQADVLNKKSRKLDYDWRDVPEVVREMALKMREVAETTFEYGWSLNDVAELSLGMPYAGKE